MNCAFTLTLGSLPVAMFEELIRKLLNFEITQKILGWFRYTFYHIQPSFDITWHECLHSKLY
jgi:hypothetical protein